MDATTRTRTRPGAASTTACPYVELGRRCCESRFTLDRIDEAFSLCFGSHHGCEHYHRMRREELEAEAEGGPVVQPVVLTITGYERRVGHVGIRPTGT